MSASTFLMAAVITLISAVWLAALLLSIMSGPPGRQERMRWRERVLLVLSFLLVAVLVLSWTSGG